MSLFQLAGYTVIKISSWRTCSDNDFTVQKKVLSLSIIVFEHNEEVGRKNCLAHGLSVNDWKTGDKVILLYFNF